MHWFIIPHQIEGSLPDAIASLASVGVAFELTSTCRAPAADERIRPMRDDTSSEHPMGLRVMNDYGVELPLWPDDIDFDVDELDLSDELRADLRAFAVRWEEAIDPEVFDDRWDGVFMMQSLVSLKYTLNRLVHPARQQAARAEWKDIRRTGEALTVRVQEELGPAYLVRYHG